MYYYICFGILVSCVIFCAVNSQSSDKEDITWCTISEEEQKKCQDLSRDIARSGDFTYNLLCKQAADKDQCMDFIDAGRAHLITLDPGEIFVAGRYNSLVPIMAERYGPDRAEGYYAVAVIPETFNVKSIVDLEDKKACFPGVGQMAGWVIPIGTLIEKDVIEVKDCNNLVKTAASFFSSSCAPNSLIDKYNPTGDNPQHMCDLCAGEKSTRCSGSDPFSNFDGAFNCLINGGEVAFLKHTTVEEMTQKPGYRGPGKNQFKLLCPNGLTSSIDSFKSCNWGFVPAHAVVTSSAVLPKTRRMYQDFLLKLSSRYGSSTGSSETRWDDSTRFGNARNPNYNSDHSDNTFQLFGENSDYQGYSNLLFQDTTVSLATLEESQQTFKGYLGNVESYHNRLQKCPIPPARLCVVSDQELRKCQKMKTAFRAQMLKPDLVCVKEYSQSKCMQIISEGIADLAILDAGDVYIAGHKYNLMPIIAEQYDLEDPSYYAVAVARQPDKDTDLLYLKGKKSCHTGIGMAAGWVLPMSFLLSSERMRSYGCDSAHAAAEFFQKSCVPGALSREYTVGDWQYDTLCDLCHGSSYHFCSRSPSEPFYGHTGALRCLVEGGGQIAFVKHTTILENTAGKNQDWWSRPMMPDDFELLCRDGTRAPFYKYAECNLGRVAANAIVADKNRPQQYINAYIYLFLYAQQFYGSKYSEEFTFKMFVSEDGFSDLIFQDATQQLKVIPRDKRNYKDYLGNEFIQAMKIVDCAASASFTKSSVFITFIFAFIIALRHF